VVEQRVVQAEGMVEILGVEQDPLGEIERVGDAALMASQDRQPQLG